MIWPWFPPGLPWLAGADYLISHYGNLFRDQRRFPIDVDRPKRRILCSVHLDKPHSLYHWQLRDRYWAFCGWELSFSRNGGQLGPDSRVTGSNWSGRCRNKIQRRNAGPL